jgi:hypothetical protein
VGIPTFLDWRKPDICTLGRQRKTLLVLSIPEGSWTKRAAVCTILLDRVVVGLFGEQLLESSILPFELQQALCLVQAQAAGLLAPAVVRLLGDPELPGHFGRRLALGACSSSASCSIRIVG